MDAIRQLVIRMLMRGGKSGIVTTLPKKNIVDFQTMILAEKFMQNGVDPRVFKNADQAENVLKQIEQAETNQIRNLDVSSGKVFDLQGKEIPPGSKIMGGKGVDDLPPLGSRGGAEDIAAPVQSAEQTIKNMIEAENKKTINKIKQRQKMLNEAIDNVSPGLSGDRKVDAALVAEDLAERMGKVYDDLPIREQTKLYGEAFDALTKKKFDPPEDLATGGRVGFSKGSSGILKFLQNMLKSKKPKIFDEERFRQGPIDLDFLENIKSKDIEKFIKTRDTKGVGGYGMYDSFDDMPAGLKAAELISRIRKKGGGIDYEAAEIFLGKKLKGNESVDELIQMLNRQEMRAEGGRIGLKVGSGKKFLQKVFGKQGLEDMKTRDPEMFVGLLEVVDMYRKRDKEGLKMYLQKFLPHMDDAEIEDFIRGSDGSEGLIGELIRLGSGRDYAGKIEMMKKADEMRKLDNLEITEDMIRKPNADGGRAGFKSGSYLFQGLKDLGKKYRGSTLEAILENPKLIGADLGYEGLAEIFRMSGMMRDGGRAGYKLGIGPLIEFLAKASKTSPLQFGKNYMKNIREKTLRANETGKFMDLPIAEAGLPAASGALITNQVKKKLKSINEEERQKNKDEMFKEISQEYKERYKDDPEFLEKMLLSLHENIYMDKKADGGRVGLKAGSLKKFLERRNFLKTIVGNSPEAENKRTLEKLLEERRELRKALEKNPPFKFPAPGDKEYDDYILRLNQIMAKDRLKSATGGRIGYKVGGFDKARRAFLKMLGLGAGTAAAVKSGILGFGKSPPTKKLIEKVPINSSTTSVPPPYFFELAEKIKKLGKPDKVTYQDRVEIHRYTGKNGDEYELIEDLSTGDMTITKDKTGVGTYGDKSVDTIQDRTVLEYRKGDADVDIETQRGYRSADEYEEYKVEFDPDGTPADATDMDAIVQKEIIAEATGDAPSIKKASGGIARMLGE